jgi:hypothetical protein
MPNTLKRYPYRGDNKMYGTLASSSSSVQIPNSGFHRIRLASTYTLQGPVEGSLVTLYATSVDASVVSKTSTGGQVAFDDNGGTQVLNLLYDSTVKNCPCVTLLGESSTQWRIIGAVAPPVNLVSSNAGVTVTT